MVKRLSHHTTDQKWHLLSLYMSKKSVYGLHQGPLMTNAQMVDKLKSMVEAVEDIVGAVGVDTNLVEEYFSAYLK